MLGNSWDCGVGGLQAKQALWGWKLGAGLGESKVHAWPGSFGWGVGSLAELGMLSPPGRKRG